MTHFSSVLRLELRKQWRTFLSVLFVLGAGCGVAMLVSAQYKEWEPARIFRALMSLALSLGTPLIAVLLGAAPAAGLRREPEPGIEQALPVAPRTRVLGSFAAGMIYFLLIQTLLLSVGAMAGGTDSASQLLSGILSGSLTTGWLLLMLQAYAVSFAVSYWGRMPFVGAAVAMIVAATELVLLTDYQYVARIGWSPEMPSASIAGPDLAAANNILISCIALTGCFSAMWCTVFLSRQLERGKALGIWKTALAAAALALAVGIQIIFAMKVLFIDSVYGM